MRVAIIQRHDETEKHLIIGGVIEEASPLGRVVQRPACRMYDQPLFMLIRIDLPDLFQTDPVMLRIGVCAKIEFSASATDPDCRDNLQLTRCTCHANRSPAGTKLCARRPGQYPCHWFVRRTPDPRRQRLPSPPQIRETRPHPAILPARPSSDTSVQDSGCSCPDCAWSAGRAGSAPAPRRACPVR